MSSDFLWPRLQLFLEDDEEPVFEEFFDDDNLYSVYDRVNGVGFIVLLPDGGLDFVWSRSLDRAMRTNPSLRIVRKVLICRKRLPWTKSRYEWLVSQEELENIRKQVQVANVFIRARDRRKPEKGVFLIQPLIFESDPENYEVIDVRFLVYYKSPYDPKPKVVTGHVETYMEL